MRTFCCSLLILAAAIALPQNVTYRTVAKSADKVLADLSTASEKKLRAAPAVAKLALILNVTDRPIQEVLDNVAKATVGKWERKTDELWLVPDPIARREREKEFLASQDRAFRAAVEAYEKPGMYDPYPGTAADLKTRKGFLSPIERLGFRLLKSLPPGSISSPRSVNILKFSSSPTLFEKPFPQSIAPLLETYRKEAMEYARLFPGSEPETLTRVQLEVSDPTDVPRVIGIRAFHANGQATSTFPLASGYLPPVPKDLPAEVTDAIERKHSKRTEQLPTGEGVHKKVAYPEIMPSLLKPEEFDPLSTFQSDFWLQVSDLAKVNLVACPSDRLWCWNRWFLRDVKSLRKAAQAFWEPTAKIENGWLTCSPRSEGAGFRQVDRAALGKFLRQRAKVGYDTFDSWVELVRAVGTIHDVHLIGEYVDQVVPGTPKTVAFDWPMLHVFAELSEAQRARLFQGEAVPLKSLSPLALEAAREWLLGPGLLPLFFNASEGSLRLQTKEADLFWVLRREKDSVSSPVTYSVEELAAAGKESAYWRPDLPMQLVRRQVATLGLELEGNFLERESGEIRVAPKADKWFSLKAMPKDVEAMLRGKG